MIPVYPIPLLDLSHPGAMFIVATAAPRVSIVVVLSFCDVSWPFSVRSLSCSQIIQRIICLCTAVLYLSALKATVILLGIVPMV